MTKCPYVPPHPWDVDFPHLMLRAKAARYKRGDVTLRDKLLSNTDALGHFAGIPIVTQARIGEPVFKAMAEHASTYIASDCQLAGHHIAPGHRRERGAQRTACAPVVPASKSVWHLTYDGLFVLRYFNMTISRDSLLTLEAYAKLRDRARAEVIEHEKKRCVRLGNHLSFLFEDETTIRYQIQEMLHIEKNFR